MLEELKQQVCAANLKLVAEGLVVQTWGNASGIDRARGLVVIKPSGVPYDGMKPQHMVVISLGSGRVVDGYLKPSLDTPTHLELYRAFPKIGGVVHTHSLYATAWAQAGRGIPSFGTTQADYWYGEVPCTRALTAAEIKNDYEKNTGLVIAKLFKKLNPLEHPAVLVASHGPFTWGKNVDDAIHIFPPRERPVARHQDRRMFERIQFLEQLCDDESGVFFVIVFDLRRRQRARAGNFAIPIIRLRRAEGWNSPARLRPRCRVKAVRVDDAADFWKRT